MFAGSSEKMSAGEQSVLHPAASLAARIEDTKAFFDRIAYKSQWLTLSLEEKIVVETAIRELAIGPGSRILEPGCGAGRVTKLLAPVVGDHGDVFSFDISRNMVRRARRNGASRRLFAHASVLDIPLRNDSVDAVLCFNCFHLFACPPKALREMGRVLRPGGRLAIVNAKSFADPGANSRDCPGPHDTAIDPLADFLKIISMFNYRIMKVFDSENHFLVLLQC